ncbi:MAG: response regulator [Bacteroidales bacterium]|nr:response regulator [Bacteroidales bacterium]
MKTKIIIITALLCLAAPAAAQYPTPYADALFSYMTVEDGLPNNFVNDIYKDSHGFIWISTYGGGLLRYDGYDYKHFTTRSAVPVKSNFVIQTCEDNFNRLWILSEGGIDIFNLDDGSECSIQLFANVNQNLLKQSGSFIVKDSQGSIYTATGSSIFKTSFSTNGSISYINTLYSRYDSEYPITAIFEYDGQMLAGIDNTVMKLIADDNMGITAKAFSPALANLPCNNIKCITAKENELWVGTNDGLFRFNPSVPGVKTYRHSDNDPKTITQNLVSDLKIADNGQLLVATLKGLNFYDSMNDCFASIENNENARFGKSLNSNFINCLFCDGSIIWIGTESGGINKLSKPIIGIKNHTHQPGDESSIASGPVNSIYVDSTNTIWAGCIEGGLNMMKSGTGKFRHFTTSSGLPHNSISCIEPVAPGVLWLGTWGNGISIFDSRQLKVVKNLTPQSTSLPIDFIGSLKYDSISHGIWIGCTKGFLFYDLAKESFAPPLPDSINHNINGCLGITITNDHYLLAACTKGIVKINLKSFAANHQKFEYQVLLPNPDDRNTQYRNKVTFLTQTHDGTVWVGTDGYGLIKISKANGTTQTTQFTTDNGLPNDIVCQILEDNMHRVWIATANGLCCYSPNSERISTYYKQEGLVSNQFFWNGCYKPRDAYKLYFGNNQGLVEIDTERSYPSGPNRVSLTNLLVDNVLATPSKGGFIEKDIDIDNCIRLHERNKSFTIEFSALNYASPASVIYQYRLSGFNDEWTTVPSSRRFAGYTNIPAGEYTFQVKCATGANEFSLPKEITVIVDSYFYKTWWFVLIAVAAVMLLAWQVVRTRTRVLQLQKQDLEKKIGERTADLKNKTEELSRQNEILFKQNDEISRQKTQMEEMTHKIQELTVDKLAFFTNITHEFRTPLTLILGPIDRALKLSTNPKVIEQLNFVSRNSRHLLSLVNQLMDFRKVESGNMQISPTSGNFPTFVDDMLLPFRAYAMDHGITLSFYKHLPNAYIMFDREAMTKIITNLLGNAIKFTPDGGKVSVYAASLRNPDRLYVCVSDTGSGIVQEDIEKIFNSFYQSKGQEDVKVSGQSGTGIGLYLCKRLANLLGGDIAAKNNRKRGASFRLIIPLESTESQSVAPVTNLVDGSIYDNTDDDHIADNPEHKTTILVVEDNDDMRQYIHSILADNYVVLEASGGKDALKLLRSRSADLILSDLMMPEMDGIQLAKTVKSDIDISHIPFIMLTAKTARDAQLESFKSGIDDYILKPFDEDMLKAKIEAVIENRNRCQMKFRNEMDSDVLEIAEDSNDKKFIEKALKIIKENYRNADYEVTEFVEQMGMSKTLVNKKMQSLTNQSAGQFIRNFRLKIAKELLIKNRISRNMNISEIAYDVGFNDPKYFTRCFTKHFNTTPSSLLGDPE